MQFELVLVLCDLQLFGIFAGDGICPPFARTPRSEVLPTAALMPRIRAWCLCLPAPCATGKRKARGLIYSVCSCLLCGRVRNGGMVRARRRRSFLGLHRYVRQFARASMSSFFRGVGAAGTDTGRSNPSDNNWRGIRNFRFHYGYRHACLAGRRCDFPYTAPPYPGPCMPSLV